jgi:hypothetical protein
MERIREKVLQIMDELEKLSEHDYRTFELALVLFLRSDKNEVKSKSHVTDKMLETIDKLIDESDTLMSDDLKEQVDDTLMLF